MNEKTFPGIIPDPFSLERQKVEFILNRSVSVFYRDDDLKQTAEWMSGKLENFYGTKTNLVHNQEITNKKDKKLYGGFI